MTTTTATTDHYGQLGYPQDWIERRSQGKALRQALTDEWQRRGIKGRQYGILSREVARATFGFTPHEHKQIKQLTKRQSLRDHMTGLEQVFSMLGEVTAMELARSSNARGFWRTRLAARQGGAIAGTARQRLESETGRPVVSSANYAALLPAGSPAQPESGRLL